MSYAALLQSSSRNRVTFLELDVDFCQNTYGQAPCTAALTGTKIKCFNTRNIQNDCQDPENYISIVKTYRFIESVHGNLPAELDGFPCLESWSISPTEINPDGGPGIRASFSAQLSDFPHHDRGIDKYVTERAYNPIKTGTFWGKFKARNPFYWGITARLVTGFLTDDGDYDPANFITRRYIVTDISGPDSTGNISISGKDPLKLLDGERAKYPAISTGKLNADIDSVQTSITLTPVGVGAEYATSGKGRMDKEIVSYTRSGDIFTITRGQSNTEATDHKTGDTFQEVGIFSAQAAEQIVYDLMIGVGMDPAFINLTDWQNESNEWFNFVYSAEIAAPESVDKLIKELGKQVGFYLWWDDIQQLIIMQAIRSVPPDPVVLTDEDNFIADSFSSLDEEDMRITEAWTYFGLLNPVEDSNDPKNFQAIEILKNQTLYKTKKIDVTYSRWILSGGVAAARSINERRVNRFKNTPRLLSFSMDLKDSNVWTGSIVLLKHRNIQKTTGEIQSLPAQILTTSDNGTNIINYKALEYNVLPLANTIPEIIISSDTVDANVKVLYESTIGPVSGPTEVRVIIDSNATVTHILGGGFPVGSVIYLDVVAGNLEGHCGDGGDGGQAHSVYNAEQEGWLTILTQAGEDGGAGGEAITMTEDWVVSRFGTSIIAAGSGGGGGGAGYASPGYASGGGGGAGGRSVLNTLGGAGGGTLISAGAEAHNGSAGTGGDANNPGMPGLGGDNGAQNNNGGTAGGYGQPGSDGGDGQRTGVNEQIPPTLLSGGKGGKAGKLAITNGHTFTFVVGNDANFVFGEIE